MTVETTDELRAELDASPAEALETVADVAEGWGGEWQTDARGGRLTLPVRAGLRIGLVEGSLTIEPREAGSTARFIPERQRWAVHWQAAVILLFGAVGGVIALAWPFFPQLLGLAPLGIILTLAAWFLVNSRLRSSGPEEFLAALTAATRRE